MLKKIAVAAVIAASSAISFSAVSATTPEPTSGSSKHAPQRSDWDPVYPDCRECVWVSSSPPAPGMPTPADVWVCPTPMHYNICPA